MRLHTQMTTTDFPMVTAESSLRMLKEMINEKRMEGFMEKRDADFSYEIPGMARFRVNAHFQRNSIAMAFRVITDKVRAARCPESARECDHPPDLSAARVGAGDGRYGFGQIDNAGGP